MAEFLVTRATPDGANTADKWRAARFVSIEEDGHSWGNKEGPPVFGIIKVPGVTKADAIRYLEEWRHQTSISIISSDPVSDSYRIRVVSDRVSVSGKNAFSEFQIGSFFSEWGASIVAFENDSVTFDISIYDAMTSPRFWDADVSGVVFVETDYDAETGNHLIQIQSSPFTAQQMRAAVERNGGVVILPDSFLMNRSVIRQRLTDDIKERIHNITYDKRRWYVTATGMSALQAAGGVITVTPQQFLNNIADGLQD